jgi:hypothetical protein
MDMRGRTFPWSRPINGARPLANTLARLGVFTVLICLLAAALNFGSAAKSGEGKRAAAAAPRAEAARTNPVKEVAATSVLARARVPLAPAPSMLFRRVAPFIETYNCTTGVAQDVFNLNDHVCARAAGVSLAAFPEFNFILYFVDP